MNITELQHALHQLRLGGMARTLETRLRQAQAEPMAPIDLLSCLISDDPGRQKEKFQPGGGQRRMPERVHFGFFFAIE